MLIQKSGTDSINEMRDLNPDAALILVCRVYAMGAVEVVDVANDIAT